MYIADPVDRFQMVKIEQQHRAARAHRSYSTVSGGSAGQRPPALPARRRLVIATATFLVSLGLLAGVAIAGDTGPSAARDACEKVAAGSRIVC